MRDDGRGVIQICGLRAEGFHGVLDFERRNGQEFVVDLAIDIEMPATDDITETVHYGELADSVVAIVSGPPVNLIETLAERISAQVLTDRRIRSVRVTVHKPQAPIAAQFDDVCVTITRSNHD
ncbi:MAG: dihydroneopterin aldolase [Acidobacteriota bacterium]|nr:dihydroneopterin aldolase [Acidobacteriota bacterium]